MLKNKKFLIFIGLLIFVAAIVAVLFIFVFNKNTNLNAAFNKFVSYQETIQKIDNEENSFEFYLSSVNAFDKTESELKNSLKYNSDIFYCLKTTDTFLNNNLCFAFLSPEYKTYLNSLEKTYSEFENELKKLTDYCNNNLNDFLKLANKTAPDQNDYGKEFNKLSSAVIEKIALMYEICFKIINETCTKGFTINNVTTTYLNEFIKTLKLIPENNSLISQNLLSYVKVSSCLTVNNTKTTEQIISDFRGIIPEGQS